MKLSQREVSDIYWKNRDKYECFYTFLKCIRVVNLPLLPKDIKRLIFSCLKKVIYFHSCVYKDSKLQYVYKGSNNTHNSSKIKYLELVEPIKILIPKESLLCRHISAKRNNNDESRLRFAFDINKIHADKIIEVEQNIINTMKDFLPNIFNKWKPNIKLTNNKYTLFHNKTMSVYDFSFNGSYLSFDEFSNITSLSTKLDNSDNITVNEIVQYPVALTIVHITRSKKNVWSINFKLEVL